VTGTSEHVWTPPSAHDPDKIPPEIENWLSGHACVTLATLEPDGRAQLSVVWATCTNGVLLMSTVVGRRKYRNLRRDPRATVLVTPPDSQDHYVEIRGTVDILAEGGREFIDDLHEHYRGTRPYPWDAPDDERVVLALRPERVLVFHG
jgi:PPOX class probable F420-dependent enzyme